MTCEGCIARDAEIVGLRARLALAEAIATAAHARVYRGEIQASPDRVEAAAPSPPPDLGPAKSNEAIVELRRIAILEILLAEPDGLEAELIQERLRERLDDLGQMTRQRSFNAYRAAIERLAAVGFVRREVRRWFLTTTGEELAIALTVGDR